MRAAYRVQLINFVHVTPDKSADGKQFVLPPRDEIRSGPRLPDYGSERMILFFLQINHANALINIIYRRPCLVYNRFYRG